MDVVRHIQVKEAEPEGGPTEFPVRLVQAGVSHVFPGSHLSPSDGNSSCPELWNKAQNMYRDACAEPNGKEHFRKLMEAGFAFTDVVMATGHFPIEKSFAVNNLGLIMQATDHMELALKSFAMALTLNPDNATILQNFGTAKMILGDWPVANEYFIKALAKNPKCAEARWNLALIALTFGDFRRGFINYESRWQCGTFTWRQLKTKRPQWKGQSLKGKTILLTHEQGFGDSIQFIRYAKMVKALGPAKVRYLCLPELVCVLKDVEGIDSVTEFADINRDGTAGDEDFDYHVPLLSLPKIFKTRLDTVPWDGPYVKIPRPHKRCDKCQIEFKGLGRRRYCPHCGDCHCEICNGSDHVLSHSINGKPYPKHKIGIVWAGRKEHANDKNRSMTVDDLAPLFALDGFIWYSLQFGPRAQEVSKFTNVYAPPLKSFADTAWWLNELDLIISVDTAAVHLAGAMGRPAWALLSQASDWRWMLDREDSPWYPTLRLWRQKTKGDWSEVIQRVKDELCKNNAQQST